MNTIVTASGMQVKAKAEAGLLINETDSASATTWDNEALAGQSEAIELHATSTANTSTWYTATSKKSNSSASASSNQASGDLTDGYHQLGSGDYTTSTETVNAVAGTSAAREIVYIDADGQNDYDNGEGYYVKYTYYVKSSGDSITLGTETGNQNFTIKSVSATGNSTSANLDKALRVAVVVNGKAYIFAPITGGTSSYYVNASETATTVLSGSQPTDLTSLPAKTETGTAIYVYLWFEGEDANLNTDNITATLDSLTVTVEFSLTDLSSTATINGVSTSN